MTAIPARRRSSCSALDAPEHPDATSGNWPPRCRVWAAGFPLGDPEYTITRGIVSKEDTALASSWAELDHVIEHDAVFGAVTPVAHSLTRRAASSA